MLVVAPTMAPTLRCPLLLLIWLAGEALGEDPVVPTTIEGVADPLEAVLDKEEVVWPAPIVPEGAEDARLTPGGAKVEANVEATKIVCADEVTPPPVLEVAAAEDNKVVEEAVGVVDVVEAV